MSVQFALMAAQMYLSIITQPRPKRLTFKDLLDSNKGDESRPIPYIRGRWKTTPQRIWLGDFSARAVERDSVWTDFVFFGPVLATLLDTITVGYRYYVGQGFALSWGPINRVHQVYVQDLPCAVAPSVDNAGGSILLDDPSLFGGDQPPGGGGIYGVGDVIAGNYTQGRNPYLQSVEGNVPALHGVAALIIRGRSGARESGYFSANVLELREWKVELMAWPDVLSTGNAMLPDQSFNRVHAMYEWTTSADYGAKYPPEHIHLPSWRQAAVDCYDDGLGFSGEINTGGNVGEVFDQLRASVDAEVYEHPRDGLKIKLIRKDYSLPALKVLDESNVSSVEEYTPGDNADTFNRVTLNYVNAENNYQPRPAVYEDPANYHLQQRPSTREIQYPGVASAELAQKLVTRDGRALAQPFPPLTVNANDDGEDLWPGDVYHFQWRDPLVRKVFRVHSRTPGTSYEGERKFRLTSTEDQYSIGLSVFGTPTGTNATNPADIWNTAPPSVELDEVLLPPDGLKFTLQVGISGTLDSFITGAIIFGSYAGGQYARVYVTEPGGTEILSPLKLSPDADDKAQFNWPAGASGDYQFCIQTYSLTGATNGVKVCATIGAASFSPSPSSSVSPSPSASLSPSSSVSPSPSASLSPSSSASPSASQSPSSSASASVSSSISPSSSVSPSHSLSPSSSASPSSSTSPSTSPSAPPITSMLELQADVGLSGLSDDDEITTWEDQSGNGRDGIGHADGGVSKPIFKATAGPGGRPCVRLLGDTAVGFNRTGFDLASSIPVSDYTIFAVIKPASGSAPYTITGGGGGAFQYRIDPLKQNVVRLNQANLGSSSTDLSTTAFQLIAVTYDGSTLEFRRNCASDGSVSVSSTQTNPIANVFGWNGASFTDREEFVGDVCMIKIFDFVLSPSEIAVEEAAAATRWGVACAALDDFDTTDMLWRVRAADESYADNDLVNIAHDLSLNGFDWTATLGDRPTFKTNQINGHPAFRFDARRLFGPNLTGLGLTEIDVYILAWIDNDPPALGGDTGLWTLNNHDGAFSAGTFPFTDGNIYEAALLSGVSDQRVVVNPTPSLTSPRLYRVTAKTGSNAYTMELDGVNIATATRATLQFPSAPELGNSRNDSAGNSLRGYVAEFFAFSVKRNSTQNTEITNYLNSFYGLSI